MQCLLKRINFWQARKIFVPNSLQNNPPHNPYKEPEEQQTYLTCQSAADLAVVVTSVHPLEPLRAPHPFSSFRQTTCSSSSLRARDSSLGLERLAEHVGIIIISSPPMNTSQVLTFV